jgi:hypothetical protein
MFESTIAKLLWGAWCLGGYAYLLNTDAPIGRWPNVKRLFISGPACWAMLVGVALLDPMWAYKTIFK